MDRDGLNKEVDNMEAQEQLAAALGENLVSKPKISTGEQIRSELMERAMQKQKTKEVPASIRNVSFNYTRSRLGTEPAKNGSEAAKKIKDQRERRLAERTERFSNLSNQDDKKGSGRSAKSNSLGNKGTAKK